MLLPRRSTAVHAFRRRAPLALVLLALPIGTAAAPAPRYDFSRVDAELGRQCAAGTFSGVVVVRAHGHDVYEKACGEADIVNHIANTRTTRFKIYSVSKFITALTVMRLVELHEMALDAPITRYVPDAPAQWRAVTIRELLNHTSGIRDLTDQLVSHFRSDHRAAMRGTLAALKPGEAVLATAPGTHFAYNNFGFELLADAAAQAAGKPFAVLVKTLVFEPAGMTTASVEAPNMADGHPVAVSEDGLAIGYNGSPDKLQQADNWAFVQLGAGAVHASANDFVALDAALRAGKIVARQSLDEMRRDPVTGTGYDTGWWFGLGMMIAKPVDGVRSEGHTGGVNGYITDFERYPDDEAMMIAVSNRGFTKTAWLRKGVAAAIKAARPG